jgi:hypothetical protein
MSHVELKLPQLADMAQEVFSLRQLVTELHNMVARLSDPKPQWEIMGDAIKRRRVDRRTLLAAVKAGRVKCERRHRRGPVAAYFLSIADLDQHFPASEKA